MMPEFVPSDHILDEFLAKHGVKVPLPEFGALLGSLRIAMEAEAVSDGALAIPAAPAGVSDERKAEFNGYLDGLRDAKQAGEDNTDGLGNLYRLDWLDAMEKLRDDAFKAMDAAGPQIERDSTVDLLRKHPAEPAGVSDEAVEAAAVAWAPFWATSTTDATRKAIRKQTRKALEAAAPFMRPQVVASRCTNCEADTLACTACGARVEPWG